MKIKEVCEKTELTDKAIRTYIRNGLVFPDYDEKYTGRKNFNFSKEDVERLRQIAILRKYGFSLKEIKSLIDNEVSAKDFLNKHISDLKSDVNSNINVINSMLNVSNESFNDMEDMCAKLNNPQIAGRPIPVDDSKNPYKLMFEKEKKVSKLFQILFSVTVLIFTVILPLFDASLIITDKSCTISSDYESLEYLGNTYLKFDSGEYEAELGAVLVENAAVEDDNFITKFHISDSLYSVANAPNSEIVFLQTDYDYDYPESKSEYYYVEESVYHKYTELINDYKATKYEFKICNEKYDYIYIPIKDELVNELLSIDKSTSETAKISGYFQAGYNEGIPVCAFDKSAVFYKYIGEILELSDKYYYFDYSDVNIKKDSVTKLSAKVYKIDSKYDKDIAEVLDEENGITIKFGNDE